MTKRILLCLMAALMLFPFAAWAEEETNLLKNPGFESLDADGLPSGWYTEGYNTLAGVSQFSVTADAYSGSHAAVVQNHEMNDARFAQRVKVEPGTIYRLSGWIRATNILDAGRGANLSIEGGYFFSESLYETEGQWTYMEYYGRTGNDQTELTVYARVGGYSGESVGTAAFDDLSLVAVQDLPVDAFPEAWYTIQQPVRIDTPVEEETSVAQPFWPWLVAMSIGYGIIAFMVLGHLQLKRDPLGRANIPDGEGLCIGHMPLFAAVGLLAAALLRLFVALQVDGYQVDVNCFTAWGNNMVSAGPTRFYQTNWCDYTPAYIYVMGLNGQVASWLSPLVDAAFVHKLVPMLCDLLASWLIYHLAANRGFTRRQAGLLMLVFAFNPATILNSAAWCQIDSVLCFGLMLVAYFAFQRRWSVVMPLYVLCALIKPQALMLGFLGLAALLQCMEREEPALSFRGKPSTFLREAGIGVAASAVVALVVVLPFSPNQESPFWLFELYRNTLASYPYATVNTTNLYYLVGANWDGIGNAASPVLCGFFLLLSLSWGTYVFFRQRGKRRYWYVEPVLMGLYACVYLLLMILGCSWTVLGIAAMSMVFALILPMYLRAGKLYHLPLCGAVIFILLYVLGIKMHERYVFPALFLLGMAYAIRRDRRIFALLIGTSCVLFINEGIVLDNSIRLGSSLGHLNADTKTLANLLSLMNVGFALVSIWLCHRICVERAPVRLSDGIAAPVAPVRTYEKSPCTPLNFKADARLGLKPLDGVLMLVVTAVYAVVTLTTLGSTKAPQNPWKSSAYDERVYIDLGRQYEDFSMLYFGQVNYSNFAVTVSNNVDRDGWSEEYPAEMAEGMCFSWQYLDPSYRSNGENVFVSATDFSGVQKLSGRYVCIIPKQFGLTLNEVIFKDAQGNIIPGVSIMGQEGGNESSPLYSSAQNLLDEQDTLEGEPSWWNSTYFDEIYHARTAFEHLNGTTAYEWTHPPLGKIIMSWFIGLFGMTPFGWRFAGALCGILMLPAMYLLVKQLTKRRDLAFVAMMLMTLDCMHFTQTRLATIDSYPVLFILLSYFFMLRFMQRDIVLEKTKSLLPDLALSGFFMGCAVSSKWIGAYAGIGLAVLYFWTCLRHLRMGRMAGSVLAVTDAAPLAEADAQLLHRRSEESFKRIVVLCLWCLLFFVAVPLTIYVLCYTVHYAYMDFDSVGSFLRTVINCQESMLSYHGQKGLGMDHVFHSPWYDWPLMGTPMYYASAAFKPVGKTYAIFCFGNPWVWCIGLAGIAYVVYRWAKGHRYALAGSDGTLRLYRDDWNVAPAFVLIGLLAQFLPWVLVPRGTYIYHYFASVPFLIIGTTLLLGAITERWKKQGRWIIAGYLLLCLVWFVLLFPYASGLMTSEAWMDFIRDYPYISSINGYWESDFLVNLNNLLENIPIFPNVYHH